MDNNINPYFVEIIIIKTLLLINRNNNEILFKEISFLGPPSYASMSLFRWGVFTVIFTIYFFGQSIVEK